MMGGRDRIRDERRREEKRRLEEETGRRKEYAHHTLPTGADSPRRPRSPRKTRRGETPLRLRGGGELGDLKQQLIAKDAEIKALGDRNASMEEKNKAIREAEAIQAQIDQLEQGYDTQGTLGELWRTLDPKSGQARPKKKRRDDDARMSAFANKLFERIKHRIPTSKPSGGVQTIPIPMPIPIPSNPVRTGIAEKKALAPNIVMKQTVKQSVNPKKKQTVRRRYNDLKKQVLKKLRDGKGTEYKKLSKALTGSRKERASARKALKKRLANKYKLLKGKIMSSARKKTDEVRKMITEIKNVKW